jgi:signal transduction histidine kinase
VRQYPSQAHTWIFYVTAGFLVGTTVLRLLINYQHDPRFISMMGVLAGWLLLFVGAAMIMAKQGRWLPVYLLLQSLLIAELFSLANGEDYIAALFGILSMQIMQWTNPKVGAVWISFFAVLMTFPLVHAYGLLGGVAIAFIYTFGSILLASYTLAARHAREAFDYNQTLTRQRQDANRQLQEYAKQIQHLAVARERYHLARELHDSVTQTIFTMNLTAQSALTLLDLDQNRAGEQLERLNQLSQSAIAEMQTLIHELDPTQITQDGLATAIQQHIGDHRLSGNLSVSLSVEGNTLLEPLEERMLFRITREALNNIVKHARSNQATILLHLTEPLWIEISDQGQGFDLQHISSNDGIGLRSMRERAAEIGWGLRVITSPGAGTSVRVEKE